MVHFFDALSLNIFNFIHRRHPKKSIKASIASFLSISALVMATVSHAQTEADSPIADPGSNRVITPQNAVQLDGTGSISPTNTALSYAWELTQIPDGSLASLNNPNSPRPDFTPDLAGSYIAALTVSDSSGNISTTQTVTLSTENLPPVTIAGPDRSMFLGETLRLDPEGTYDPNGDRLSATWSILSTPIPSESEAPAEPTNNNTVCPSNAVESLGTFHVVSATSNQQNPHLAVGQPLPEGTTETGNNSATTYYGPITMDLTGDPSIFVPEGEMIDIVLSSAWGTAGRAEILMSADGETYTSLGTVGAGGSAYPAYSSNILRYDEFTVPAGGARFLQVFQQNAGIRADGVIYQTQCQSPDGASSDTGDDTPENASTLIEDEGGRYVFTPDTPGEYAVQLLVEDGLGGQSTDIVTIFVGENDGSSNPEDLNIAPIANAGTGQLITIDQIVTLDATQSTDVNGDTLSYLWTILSKPADSFRSIEDETSPIASFTPDTDRLYVLQLEVTDSFGAKAYDTIILDGSAVNPVARSGGPDASQDGAIVGQLASVDGSTSLSGNGQGIGLAYQWSVLGLSDGESEIETPENVSTSINFQLGEEESGSNIGSEGTVALLSDYNVIVFNDLDSNVDIAGRAFIGGQIFGQSSTFGTQLPQGQNIDALTVIGDISGGPKNINNGGNVRHGGQISTQVNLNGGGQLISDDTLSIGSEQAALISLSTDLSGAEPNSIAQIPDPFGQHGPARLNATPNEDGVAVFNIEDGNLLFRNDRVQQIEVNANGAETIIVNIGGADIDFTRGNFVGAVQNNDTRQRIIWNFHEATDLFFDRAVHGTVLAPNAHLFNRTNIFGAVVVDSFQARGPISLPGFNGGGLEIDAPSIETNFALVQLTVSDANDGSLPPAHDSVILTTGNLRPVANITQTGGENPVETGEEITLDGTSSSDGDSDTLSYDWSLLSRPSGSTLALEANMTASQTLVIDASGTYVFQLIVNDGELASRAVTYVVLTDPNQPPIANAGPDQIGEIGERFTLTGAASSDPDGDSLLYSWTITGRPTGSQTALISEDSVNPEFVADVPGDYIISLTVNDGLENSAADEVVVSVPNTPPVAVISGPSSGVTSDVLMYSAVQSSDVENDPLTYNWSLFGPEGSVASLDDPTALAPRFTPDIGGEYMLQLVVSDGFDVSDTATLIIEVGQENRPPILEAESDQAVSLGSTLSVNLSATDPDNDDLTYFATPQPLPVGAQFDATTGVFSYTPASLEPESFVVSFSVSDGEFTDRDDVTIVVNNDTLSDTTQLTGRIVDSVTNSPISGALVMIGDVATRTDAFGIFVLTDVPAGQSTVWVLADSETATDGDGNLYGTTQFQVDLIENVDNVRADDVRLAPRSSSTPIIPENATQFESSIGITLEIPENAIVGTGVTSRYWRLFVNDIPNNGERTSFGEWELREFVTGRNALVGGEITSSSDFSGSFTPGNLLDGTPDTGWAASPRGGVDDWVAYDLGDGNARTMVELVIQARNSTTFAPQQTPIDFDLQISEDGQNWETIRIFTTPATWVASEIRTFNIADPFSGDIFISEISSEQANLLPDNVEPCQLFSIGPKSINIGAPITIMAQNLDNLPAQAVVDLWSFDGTEFAIVASGAVSDDAQTVTAEIPVLIGGQIFGFAPRAGTLDVSIDQPDDVFIPSVLGEGNFTTSYDLPTYSSVGEDRALSLTYNSVTAAPSPFVSTELNLPENSGTPVSFTQNILIGQSNVSLNLETVLDEDIGDIRQINQSGNFDASELPTGSYPVTFMSTQNYSCSRVSSSVETEIFVNNQSESPLGSGWTFAEISRLQIDDQGTAQIINGNGSILEFAPEQELGSIRDSFIADVGGDFVPVVTDFDNNGTQDIVAVDTVRGTLRFFENQGGGIIVENTAFELTVAVGLATAPRPAGGASDTSPLRAIDFNGDGMMEFVIASGRMDAIQIVAYNGVGFVITQSIPTFDNIRQIDIDDYDGDGFDDILTFNGSSLRFYLNDGLNNFSTPISQSRSGIDSGVGDFNGDGRPDVVVLSGSSAFIRTNEGDLDFRSQTVSLPRSANRFTGQNIQVGDVDLDGDDDIIFSTLPNVTYVENLGNSEFRAVELVRPDGFGNADNVTLADVTGDGLLDVLVDERTPQPRYALFVKLREGDFEPAQSVVFGHPIGESLVTDVDQDGFQDLVSKSRFELYVDFGQAPEDGNFISPFTDFSSLIRNNDGSFTRRFTNGTEVNYSAEGLQTSTIDRNGNETQYEYDSEGRLITIIDPVGLRTVLEYNNYGQLSSVTDPANRTNIFTQDAAGNLIEITDPEDQPTRYSYDERKRLNSITDKRALEAVNMYGSGGSYNGSELADGTEIGLSVARSLGLPDLGSTQGEFVDPDDRISRVADGRGNVTETEVNQYGSVIRVNDPIGRETRYERNSDNLVVVIIEPSSVTPSGTLRQELTYDIRGNLTSRTEAVGTSFERVMIYEYEPVFSRPIRMVDYDGFETTMEYDEFGNRVRLVDPLDGIELRRYNERGQVISMTDKVGNETLFEYDLFSRLSFVTDASNIRQQMVYDDAGNIIEVIDDIDGPEERRMSYSFDNLNRKTSKTAGDGGVTTYIYDGNDNIVSMTDPTGVIETRSYDVRDRLEVVNNPVLGASVLVYDEDSNITRITDALGDTTDYTFDAVDRILSSTDARGQLRAFGYDLRDNVTAITDARNHVTFIGYDELDRAIARTNPNNEQWNFAYDLRDNRVSATKPDGVILLSEYDGLSRLTRIAGGDIERNYGYDAQSNLLEANDNLAGISGADLGFTYDQENRVETASVANLFGRAALNNSFSFDYDALDRRATMSDSFDGNWAYGYDPVDRLTQVVTPRNENYSTEYDLEGRMLARMAPNVTAMARTYEDTTGRLSTQNQNSGANLFNGFSYEYTERGNIDVIAETGTIARTRNYSYDELKRLTLLDSPDAPANDESYTLDPEGNRLDSHLSATHQTDDANRLTEDDTYFYTYDLNGNLLNKTAKAGIDSPDWSYAYDSLDQLISVSREGLEVERYRYDAFGRRSAIDTIDQAGSFQRIAIVNDGSDRTIDLIDVTDGAGLATTQIKNRYSHGGQVDEPLSIEVFNSDGVFDQAYTYHTDHLGSVRFITDSVGEIVNAYDYDSYGRPGITLETIDQPFRFTGREFDQATELYHYRARQYDPETGRFIQEDPIFFESGDFNVHRYVGNNPLNFNDPSGLVLETLGMAAHRAQIAAPIQSVGQGLNCIFGGIASVFAGINEAQANGEQIVDIQVDLVQTCGAQVISEVAPAFNSEDPITTLLLEYVEAEVRRRAFRLLERVLAPSGTPGLTIFPTSSPAYPSTWKNVPFYPFR